MVGYENSWCAFSGNYLNKISHYDKDPEFGWFDILVNACLSFVCCDKKLLHSESECFIPFPWFIDI